MRIAHVLTYVSSDGSYGGPVAVAVAQCHALAARGHQVTLFAGWDGEAELDVPGVDVRLHRAIRLPGLGFAGTLSPSLWWDLLRHLQDLDAVHFHAARDLIQLPAAACTVGRVTSVVQPHGMIRVDPRLSARVLDRVWTRRVLRRASSLLALTDGEAEDLSSMAPEIRLVRIRNGINLPNHRARWRDPSTVLFLARLHSRKRPVEFVRMAALVEAERPGTTFVLVGADEGEAPAVRHEIARLGLEHSVTYRGPVPAHHVSDVLINAQVYVLPSVDEPFPMSVLEAMAHGLPTVVTTETGISGELAERFSAEVSLPSAESLSESVLSLLTEERWLQRSKVARADIKKFFSVEVVADVLEHEYGR